MSNPTRQKVLDTITDVLKRCSNTTCDYCEREIEPLSDDAEERVLQALENLGVVDYKASGG